jgi:hypothetical protein
LVLLPADPHSNLPLGLNQLYPNLVVRDMVERWLQTGDAIDGNASSSISTHLQHSHLQQQLDRHGSEDPLSSFGASSGSASSSSASL